MFGHRYRFLLTVFTALAVASLALINGCADLTRSPLAPDQAATAQAGDGKSLSPFTIVFSPEMLPQAVKKATAGGLQTETTSGWFAPDKKGRLQVNFKKYTDDNHIQVEKATFDVERGSIGAAYEITMTVVSGYTLADVSVEFTPSGPTFTPDATLTLVLRGAGLNPDEIRAYHIDGATIQSIVVDYDQQGKKKATVTLKVPGFSRYSLGGNDAAF